MITSLVIIIPLASIAIPTFNYIQKASRENKTLVLVRLISHGLEDYRRDYGTYPVADGKAGSSGELYIALYGDADGDGYVDNETNNYLPSLNPHSAKSKTPTRASNEGYLITDSWNNEIYYRSPGLINPRDDFDLWSLGVDAKGGPESNNRNATSNDICNW